MRASECKLTPLRHRVVCCLLLSLWLGLCCVHAAPIIVTVQTQSQEELNALTSAVEADAQLGATDAADGSVRHLLGAIEATQSRVYDVDNAYAVTNVQSMPTLSLLDGIQFLKSTETWTLTYDTMAIDASVPEQINHYDRILYFTKAGHASTSSDAQNACLTPGIDRQTCIQHLRDNYVLLGLPSTTISGDHLEYVPAGNDLDTCTTCSITTNLDTNAGTSIQQLTVNIPHEIIRQQLSTASTYYTDSGGAQNRLAFGVGMMFLPLADGNGGGTSPNNLLIFDMFSILENTYEQLAMLKQNAYSIATHVAFWTAAAEADPTRVRVTTVEYLLDYGHILESITASLNEGVLSAGGTMRAITDADCATMQARIDDELSGDTTCLAKYRLCEPFKYVEGSGASLQTWVAVVFPIPDWHETSTYQFNTLLRTNLTSANNNAGAVAYSTLNFATSHAPRVACKSTVTQAFDATSHVRAEIYRGHDMVFEQIAGSFTVYNDSALSMAEALVTFVLRPDDTPEALQYFQTYTDEQLRLDDLYMSHAKLEQTLPEVVHNSIEGTGNGRSRLVLDSALLAQCPRYETQGMDVGTCVTTRDWNNDGQVQRIDSTVYYVHRVSMEADGDAATADLTWLQDNIFGTSDPAMVENFRNQVLSKPFLADADARKAYSVVYWIWPVFTWPNTPPIGLVDKTVVSLAWSIAPYAAAASEE